MDPKTKSKTAKSQDKDVQGHGQPRTDTKAAPPAGEPGTGPEETYPRSTEDDVEGHSMLQNSMVSRSIAQSREREIQNNLRQHELKSEARRPFFRRGR